MINLASTSDLLRLITATDAGSNSIRVEVSWFDLLSTTNVVTPGRTNTSITTDTTTTIVASPAASTYRTVLSFTVRNQHATADCRVTVLHSDGTIIPELISVILFPGEELHYDEDGGFAVRESTTGYLCTSEERSVSATHAIGTYYRRSVSEDITNIGTTANNVLAVESLALRFKNSAGATITYWFKFTLFFSTTSPADGTRWVTTGMASPSLIVTCSEYSLGDNSKTNNEGQTASEVPASSNASSATNGGVAIIWGFFAVPNGDEGGLWLRFAGETASHATVLKAGSILEYQRVL